MTDYSKDTFDVRIDILDVKGTPMFLATGIPEGFLEQHPEALESLADMMDLMIKSNQTRGIIPGGPPLVALGEVMAYVGSPSFGEKLRYLRERAEMSQVEAAEAFKDANNEWSHCRQSTWANWEKRTSAPRGQIIDALAKMFKVRSTFFYST